LEEEMLTRLLSRASMFKLATVILLVTCGFPRTTYRYETNKKIAKV